MSAIICKCLEPGLTERYQSADALRDDLIAQYHHEPLVHQPEPSTVERMSKWCYRHPRLSSSISIASLSMILFAFLSVGAVVRQLAIERAEWIHRIDLLKERIPNSMAMLTSLDAVPELEPEVVAEINQTFALIETKNAVPKQLDHRWKTRNQDVSDDLRSDLRQLAWLTRQRSWQNAPSTPNGLVDRDGPIDELAQDELRRSPLKLIQEKKYADAIALLKMRIDKNPRDYVGWWLLGDCYHASQDLPNAQQAYTVCIALQPRTAIAYLNRGMARFSASMFGAAAEDSPPRSHLQPQRDLLAAPHCLADQRVRVLVNPARR